MIKKEIYATVEIADHEIRLVVGEFFDTRFNILRVERTPVKGVENKRITDEQDVVNGIRKVVNKQMKHWNSQLNAYWLRFQA